MAKNEVTVIEPKDYALLAFDPAEAAEAIRETVGTIDPRRDLTVLVAPGPKGKSWDVVSPAGEVEEMRSVTGIIVAKRPMRSYYADAYSPGSNTPPTCSAEPDKDGDWFGQSDDSKLNGQNCAGCPFNQFGSAAVGNGKACSEYVGLIMYRPEDSLLPIVVRVPPSALKAWRGYTMGVIKADPRTRLHNIVTEISLEPVKDDVPKWHFRLAGKVDPATAASIAARASLFSSAAPAKPVAETNQSGPDVGDGENAPF